MGINAEYMGMQQQMQGMNGQGQQGGYPQWSQQGNPTPNQGNPS